jgi:hypothetical protein
MRFSGNLRGHQIQDRHLKRTDILVLSAVFIHDENVFVFKNGARGKCGRDLYGQFNA